MKEYEKLTLDYYQENTDYFIQNTIDVDFSAICEKFLSLVPKGGTILDLGCGSCRDALYFKKRGYRVIAVDGCENLCKEGEKILGQKVYNIRFEDYDIKDDLDAIWACASLLHLKQKDIVKVLLKVCERLKINGYIYMSFKYGDFEGVKNQRYYTDMNEDKIKKIISKIDFLSIEKLSHTDDVRYKNIDEIWLNVYVKKIK